MSSIIAWIKEKFRKLRDLIFGKKSEAVDYYGCPNSNKARKLQLKKIRIR